MAMDSISCSICLDLLKDPVTIPCGHSYCKVCIMRYWNLDDQTGVYSCPQCRQTFNPKPALNRNILLAELVEKLKNAELQTVPSTPCYAGPGDVVCDQQDTVSAADRTERERQLRKKRQEFQLRICAREREMQEVKQAVKCLSLSAQAAVEDSEKIFTELIHSIEKRHTEVNELISAQQRAAESQAEGLLERLEQEVAELRWRDAELVKLSHIEDHSLFLQSFQSVCSPSEAEPLPCITVNQHVFFEDVKKSVTGLKERLEDLFKEEMVEITEKDYCQFMLPVLPCIVTASSKVLQCPELKTREDFLNYYVQLTLDPNTAYHHLCLSEGNSGVTWSDVTLSYPDHPERFTNHNQVLCIESLTETCYCEIERSGECEIAVTYKSISRRGGLECCFGSNNQSWSLVCRASSCSFWHKRNRTDIPVPCSSRVGMYLDHRAGTLSFYSVSDTMILLHRVQTLFTEPLYAGFWVGPGRESSVKMSTLRQWHN